MGKIALDWSRLLGFDQVQKQPAQEGKQALLPKVGTKVGTKVGAKIGTKVGVKVGIKPQPR